MGVRSGPKIHTVNDKPDRYTQLLVRGGGADESQTFTDSSVYGRTITASGNVKYEASDGVGKIFNIVSGIEFDGTGDYLTSSAFNFLQNKWTVECWFYYDTSFPGTIEGLIALDYDGSSGSSNNAMNFGVTDGTMALLVSSSVASGWNVVNTTGGTVSTTTWHHAAAVFDGSTYKVYLDGAEVISVSSSTPTTSSDNSRIIIGTTADSNSSQSWDGYIDEVRVSSVARYTTGFRPESLYRGPFNVNPVILSLDPAGGYKTGPELLTSGTSGQRAATYGYHQSGDIFDNATMTGFHAKHASSGQANAGGPVTLPLVLGKTYRVRFDCNIISGTGAGRPNFNLSRHYNYGSMTTDKVNRYRVQEGSDPYYTSSCVQGKNEFIVTVTTDPTWGNSCIQFVTFGAQEYTISNMSVKELFPYNDLSGQGNTGSPAGDAILAVEGYVSATVWPNPATPRHVFDFDGTGDYIDIGDVNKGLGNGSRFAKAGTMCIWLKPENIATADYVWQKNDKSGSTTYVICKAYSTNRMMFKLYGDWGWGPAVYTNATDTFGDGWHHLVTRWYPNGLDIWKDGNHHDSAVESGTWGGAGANTIRFGNNSSNDGGNGWDGQMACIQLYDAALNHQQIKDLYNSQRSRFGK